MGCNKFFLFFVNAITSALGLAVIITTSILIKKGSEYGELLSEGIISVPVWMLIFGIAITLIGFLGCFGALREDKCMLYTYSGIVLGLLIGTLVLAILIIIHPEKFKEQLEKSMENSFSKYGTGDSALDALVDQMQEDLRCCGVYDKYDWKTWDRKKWGNTLPDSCCYPEETRCTTISRDSYNIGCADALLQEIENAKIAIGVIGFLLCIVMFVGVSASCSIARKKDSHWINRY